MAAVGLADAVPAALLRWVTPDESAADFFRRQGREAVATGLPFIDAHLKLRPGHLLELVGPSGAAKTELLVQMAANVLCSGQPASSSDEQEHVVMIDCDGKFDTLRLLQALQVRLQAPGNAATSEGAQQSALARFHLVRCFSSLELLLALAALPQHLAALQGRCRMLLLDNVATFVWHDRAAVAGGHQQQPRLPGQPQQPWQSQQQPHHQLWPGGGPTQAPPGVGRAGSGSGPGLDALGVQGALAQLLQGLSSAFRCPVVATKQAGVSQTTKDGSARLVQREVLTGNWQNAVSHRLLLLPALSPDQALATLAHGPVEPLVSLQWQDRNFTGPLQQLRVTATACVLAPGPG